MIVLRESHADMGRLFMKYDGTVERFAGDAIMIFFNDHVLLPNPAEAAARLALDMHTAFEKRVTQWQKRDYDLKIGIGIGIGIAQGYATVGVIGFEGRLDCGAIGAVFQYLEPAERRSRLACLGFNRKSLDCGVSSSH